MIAGLCLTVVQLAPFAIVPIALEVQSSKYTAELAKETPAVIEDNRSYYEKVNDGKTPIDGSAGDEVAVPDYGINTILYFDGYGSIGYNKDYFTCSGLDPNTTERVLGFDDNATKLVMDYVTHLNEKTDINGYIMQEIVGIDSVTNDHISITAGENTWVCITAEKPEEITGNIQKVYYLLDKNGDSALWIKASISSLCDTAKFDALMLNMLESASVYYNSSIQVEIPKSGYYSENKITDPNRADGQAPFKEKDEENNVHNSSDTTVKTELGNDKFSMQFQLDGKIISLYNNEGQLNTLQEFLNNGYTLILDSPDSEIAQLASLTVALQAKSGKTGTNSIKVDLKNTHGDKCVTLKECSVTGVTITPPNFAGSQLPDDFFVIPGGFTTKSLRRSILDSYGTPNAEDQSIIGEDGSAQYVHKWTEGSKSVEVVTGPTNGIKSYSIKLTQ